MDQETAADVVRETIGCTCTDRLTHVVGLEPSRVQDIGPDRKSGPDQSAVHNGLVKAFLFISPADATHLETKNMYYSC